ncbi:glycosyltransferase family 4 protein [Anabaena sp. PCC 7108]|uniref:glycosyltransferase family 4 protein n=1 Tax=Anabaena sp. PCC 7108 TaxID=163908 RepID=UPI00034A69CF|nr:glycosyltransferase family 4 protein [Anabaena sp. PCC 7108]
MNIQPLILSFSDIEGGAARATFRLHQGLQTIGIKSQMLVQKKLSSDPAVAAPNTNFIRSLAGTRISLDAMPLKSYPHRKQTTFSPQWLPDTVTRKVAEIAPNIINLHWINAGYICIETIGKLKQPLVWTLHDMWAFTGGCHYSQECDRYTESCGTCPQLDSSKNSDLSSWIWQRKTKAWKNLDLTIVAPSSWMSKCANSSSLFRNLPIEVIPNGIDTKIYKPINQNLAREVLQLPLNKQLILFGSLNVTSDKRKGFHLLQEALQSLSLRKSPDNLELVIIGASQAEKSLDLCFKTHYLGTLHDDISLAMVYSAADVFVLPSTEDNLPNTIMESMACGTPCVAFNIGGIPDMIGHQQNGYLVPAYDTQDLAQGIVWLLEDEERRHKLSYQGLEKVEREYALEIQAGRYASLFCNILSSSKQRRI